MLHLFPLPSEQGTSRPWWASCPRSTTWCRSRWAAPTALQSLPPGSSTPGAVETTVASGTATLRTTSCPPWWWGWEVTALWTWRVAAGMLRLWLSQILVSFFVSRGFHRAHSWFYCSFSAVFLPCEKSASPFLLGRAAGAALCSLTNVCYVLVSTINFCDTVGITF